MQSLDYQAALMVFNLFCTVSVSVIAYFIKNWKSDVAKQLDELFQDLKKVREDIFLVNLQGEAQKSKFYAVSSQVDDFKHLRTKIEDVQLRMVKLEASLLNHCSEIPNVPHHSSSS